MSNTVVYTYYSDVPTDKHSSVSVRQTIPWQRKYPPEIILPINLMAVTWLGLRYHKIPSNFEYKTHLNNKQQNRWSLRCSWSIACRLYSSYIFILNLELGFIGMDKDNHKTRCEAFKFCDLVRLILEIWR